MPLDTLSDDVLAYAFVPSPLRALADPLILEATAALSQTSRGFRARLAAPMECLRASLPPPYPGPKALDEALASGDITRATPILADAMRRLRRNLERISERLAAHGYPLAKHCERSGRPLLTPITDLDALLQPLRERGFSVPLALELLWRHVGGITLADPLDAKHVQWWRQALPQSMCVARSGFGGGHSSGSTTASASRRTPWTVRRVDPLWVAHAAAVLNADAAGDFTPEEFTLPTSFSIDEGFAFRTAPVLHLAPDAFSKDHAHESAMNELGSYAIWLEAHPPLDPTLLRFDPPAWHEHPHGSEGGDATESAGGSTGTGTAAEAVLTSPLLTSLPNLGLPSIQPTFGEATGEEAAPFATLWRSCSLIRYLRLAVLEAGGFPGAMGLPEYERLRAELTHRLLPF